ncbi:hypothetical protein C7408_12121 [Paraburkholderia caballeronis]|nr:hypothetical protein C7408_12121 [Paraburkholderia caballeronis]TDV10906.1 hypothetical protein C7406_12321 [Paraburkholderia caballeronis]TDV22344.1 hypothetical protein C7404_11921 [Paraburkholderia caballeronis]
MSKVSILYRYRGSRLDGVSRAAPHLCGNHSGSTNHGARAMPAGAPQMSC